MPLDVIGELLGIPEDSRQEMHRLVGHASPHETTPDEPPTRRRTPIFELAAIFEESGRRPAHRPRRRHRQPHDHRRAHRRRRQRSTSPTASWRSGFLELAFAGHETVARAHPQRGGGARLVPRPATRARRRPFAHPPGRGGDAAMGSALALPGPLDHRDVELHGVTIPDDQPGDPRDRRRDPRRAAVRRAGAVRHPPGDRSPGRRSGSACTCASVPRWPASRPEWRSRSCSSLAPE